VKLSCSAHENLKLNCPQGIECGTGTLGWRCLVPRFCGRSGPTMKYPSIGEVIVADQERMSFWWHFLPDPKTPAEEHVLDLVFQKFYGSGAFIRPELAKRVRRGS